MLNLKKTAVAVLAFSSSAVFAGTMGPVCNAVNVTVPCESTSWVLGSKALYLNTNTGHFSQTATYKPASGLTQTAGLDRGPRYGWGFMIEGAYNFNTGNDLNINWYHINNGNHKYLNGNGFTTPFGSEPSGFSSISETSVSNNDGYVSVNPHWDAVDIEFGQHVDFAENNSVRVHAGFDWARVGYNAQNDQSGTSTVRIATNVAGPTPYQFNKNYEASYNGFGPRIGSDYAYDWGNGLGIYANGAFGLLAGTSKYSVTDFQIPANTTYGVSKSAMIVVPELEGKLGLTYDYATSQGDFSLDVGWMWVNYFGAVKGANFNEQAVDVNFGLQGPYVGARWVGNVA